MFLLLLSLTVTLRQVDNITEYLWRRIGIGEKVFYNTSDYFVFDKAETHENRRFFSTGM